MTKSSIDATRELIAKWYYKDLWGWKLESISEVPVRDAFLKILVVCAGADGELHEEERAWIVGRAAVAGASDEVLESLKSYTVQENPSEVISRTIADDKSKRAILYFAIKAASADQMYSEAERAAVLKVAASMNITASEVAQIEILVTEEQLLKLKRAALCFPEGNPFKG